MNLVVRPELIDGGGKDLLAEGLVALETVKRFLGGALMGFFFAVAHSIAGVDTAQDDCRAEDGVLVGIGIRVHEFKLDGDAILLGPLDKT